MILESGISSVLDIFIEWFSTTFPYLYEILSTIWGFVGLLIFFLIPGIGAGLAILIFLFLVIFKPTDLIPLTSLLIVLIIAFIIICIILIFTVGIASLIYGQNVVAILLLIILIWNLISDNLLDFFFGLFGMIGIFVLVIVIKKKKKDEKKGLCLKLGPKEICIGMKKDTKK